MLIVSVFNFSEGRGTLRTKQAIPPLFGKTSISSDVNSVVFAQTTEPHVFNDKRH